MKAPGFSFPFKPAPQNISGKCHTVPGTLNPSAWVAGNKKKQTIDPGPYLVKLHMLNDFNTDPSSEFRACGMDGNGI